MNPLGRRQFLHRAKNASLGVATGMTILNNPASARATPANDTIAMAIVGCAGRGSVLARGFASRDDCEITYFADVNQAMYEKHAQGDRQLPRRQDARSSCRTSARCSTTSRSTPSSSPRRPTGTPRRPSGAARRARTSTSKSRSATTPGKASRWSRRRGSTSGSFRSGRRTAAPLQHGRPAVHRRRQVGQGPLVRVLNQKLWENFEMAADAAPPEGFRLGHVERPGAGTRLQRHAPLSLAPPLALLHRRHGQRRRPPVRRSPDDRRLRYSQAGLLHGRDASTPRARPTRPTRRSPPSPTTTIWSSPWS